MSTLRTLLSLGTSRLRALLSALDVRDVFVFGGLALLGYGLWLLRPWLGFATTGALLMAFGLFLGKR